MMKSTNGWRERLAAMPPEQQAKVRAAIKQTLQLRRRVDAERETAELIRKWQRASRADA